MSKQLFDIIEEGFKSGDYGAFEDIERDDRFLRARVHSGEEDYIIEFTVTPKEDNKIDLIIEHEYIIGFFSKTEAEKKLKRLESLVGKDECYFENYESDGPNPFYFISYCSNSKTIDKPSRLINASCAIMDEFEFMSQQQWDTTTEKMWKFSKGVLK